MANTVPFSLLTKWHMSRSGLRLLSAFLKWMGNRVVFELSVGINSGVELEKMDRFLQRLGFRPTGGNYALALKGAKSPLSAQTTMPGKQDQGGTTP